MGGRTFEGIAEIGGVHLAKHLGRKTLAVCGFIDLVGELRNLEGECLAIDRSARHEVANQLRQGLWIAAWEVLGQDGGELSVNIGTRLFYEIQDLLTSKAVPYVLEERQEITIGELVDAFCSHPRIFQVLGLLAGEFLASQESRRCHQPLASQAEDRTCRQRLCEKLPASFDKILLNHFDPPC